MIAVWLCPGVATAWSLILAEGRVRRREEERLRADRAAVARCAETAVRR